MNFQSHCTILGVRNKRNAGVNWVFCWQWKLIVLVWLKNLFFCKLNFLSENGENYFCKNIFLFYLLRWWIYDCWWNYGFINSQQDLFCTSDQLNYCLHTETWSRYEDNSSIDHVCLFVQLINELFVYIYKIYIYIFK